MEQPDDFIADLIIRKLKDASVVVSFAEVAREAKARNRNRLAAQVLYNNSVMDDKDMHHLCFFQLLDHEVHAKDQVPLLMEMKKADVALDKAIESGDPQLGNK